jgi:glycosyltransferase involved in cell wall biosynthesis
MGKTAVLLVAYQCGPGMGSVSQLGWEWYARLSQERPVTLVTHVRNRRTLQAAGAPLPGSEIRYIDTEWFAGPLYRMAKRLFPRSEHSVFLVSSLDYFAFDIAAYRALRRDQREGSLDAELIHRVTPVTTAAPTLLGRLGLPLVIGPLNSGLSDPRGFGRIMRADSTWLIRARGLTRVVDALIGSSRRASRILVASGATLAAIGKRHRGKSRSMLENGIDLTRFQATPWPDPPIGRPLRVLFVGRLVPVKGVDLLLQAMAQVSSTGQAINLDVVGDGPLRREWHALVVRLGLADQVIFHGARPQREVARHMADCHLFCLPSVRESGGAVLLEAMASARPVVALDFGGPGEIVDDEVGVLVPMTDPAQVVADLATTLLDACAHPARWRQRGLDGRARVERHHSWPAKIAAADDLYREILNQRSLACLTV